MLARLVAVVVGVVVRLGVFPHEGAAEDVDGPGVAAAAASGSRNSNTLSSRRRKARARLWRFASAAKLAGVKSR